MLWVIINVVSGVENSPGRQYTHSNLPLARLDKLYRLRRIADEDGIQLSTTEETAIDKIHQEVYNNGSGKIITSEESSQGPDYEEDTKIKQNTKQSKYLANDFKTLSTNKIKLESALFHANESFNDKQKTNFYSVSKYNNAGTIKKDTKLTTINSTTLDVSLKTNNSQPLVENGENRSKAQLISNPMKQVTEVSDKSQEMHDQPESVISELPLNATDFNDDESLLQNSSK